MSDHEEAYLSPKEAAAIYRISARTILRLIHEGVLPAVRITARTWRIKRSDLERAFPSTPRDLAGGGPVAGRPTRRPGRGK